MDIDSPLIEQVDGYYFKNPKAPKPSHHSPNGTFINPWSSFTPTVFSDLIKWLWSADFKSAQSEEKVNVVPIDFNMINKEKKDKMFLTWLGYCFF